MEHEETNALAETPTPELKPPKLLTFKMVRLGGTTFREYPGIVIELFMGISMYIKPVACGPDYLTGDYFISWPSLEITSHMQTRAGKDYSYHGLNAAHWLLDHPELAHNAHPELKRLVDLWEFWDGNANRMGTPEQLDFLYGNRLYNERRHDPGAFEFARMILKNAGLLVVPHPVFRNIQFEFGAYPLFEPTPKSVMELIDSIEDESDRYEHLKLKLV